MAVELRLRTCGGGLLAAEGARWLSPPTREEERPLDRVREPVLDIGCGPGRHVLALKSRGVAVLGIELTPAAARLAREQGAPVMVGCVFDPIPLAGQWRTALLLDGNIGIGGEPVALLRRARELLAPDGRVMVELEPPGCGVRPRKVRLEVDEVPGPWFPWASVGVDGTRPLAAEAGLSVAEVWRGGDRWFADLRCSSNGKC